MGCAPAMFVDGGKGFLNTQLTEDENMKIAKKNRAGVSIKKKTLLI